MGVNLSELVRVGHRGLRCFREVLVTHISQGPSVGTSLPGLVEADLPRSLSESSFFPPPFLPTFPLSAARAGIITVGLRPWLWRGYVSDHKWQEGQAVVGRLAVIRRRVNIMTPVDIACKNVFVGLEARIAGRVDLLHPLLVLFITIILGVEGDVLCASPKCVPPSSYCPHTGTHLFITYFTCIL